MKNLIDRLNDFFKRNNDPYYYIDSADWNEICINVRELNEIVDWFSFLHDKFKAVLKETTELISDCHLQFEQLRQHSDNFSNFILITYLILNHQDDIALSKFNELLWEDKIFYCRLILGDKVVIYIK